MTPAPSSLSEPASESPPTDFRADLTTEFTGLILAGGQSRRFGTDKALALWQDAPLLLHVMRTLAPEVASLKLVVDRPARYPEVYAAFRASHPNVMLDELVDAFPRCGPMGGLYTGLGAMATEWALVVSCDAPLLEPVVLRLLKSRAIQGTAEVVIPMMTQRLQPLQAAWARRLHPHILEHLRSNRLKMVDLLSTVQVDCLAESDIYAVGGTSRSFINVNERATLETLGREAADPSATHR